MKKTDSSFILLLAIQFILLVALLFIQKIVLAVITFTSIILIAYLFKKTNKIINSYETTTKTLETTKIKLNEYEKIIQEYTIYSITDRYWNIVDVSDSFLKLSGYTKEELIGERHLKLHRKEQTDEIYTPIINATYQNRTWEGTFENYAKNGDKHCTKAKVFSKRDENGEIIGFVTCSKIIECA